MNETLNVWQGLVFVFSVLLFFGLLLEYVTLGDDYEEKNKITLALLGIIGGVIVFLIIVACLMTLAK